MKEQKIQYLKAQQLESQKISQDLDNDIKLMSEHDAYKKLAYFTINDLQKFMNEDINKFKTENINKIVSNYGKHYQEISNDQNILNNLNH